MPELDSNLQPSCLSLLSSWVTGVCHLTQLSVGILKEYLFFILVLILLESSTEHKIQYHIFF